MRPTTILRRLLGVTQLNVENGHVAADGPLAVWVRPSWRRSRCGACGRRAPRYDRRPRRRWLHVPWGRTPVWLQYAPWRVSCRQCGVRVERVSWAVGNSAFTAQLEELTAYLAQVTDRTTVSRVLGISWPAVGSIVERVVTRQLNKALKGTRFCLLKHPARLKPGEKRRLETLRRQNRALDRAYRLKEYLAIILEQATPDEAPDLLDEWLAWAARSRLRPIVTLARTVRKHAAGILAYLDTKMTNGPVEGINNKLRVIARRAYGFHSHGALISMLFLCCGGIELAPPLPTPV